MAILKAADPHPQTFAQSFLGPDNPKELRLIAISSLSGAATIDGTSGALGNAHDSALLAALRSWSDAVLVTASTAAKESYVAPTSLEEDAQQRIQRGQLPHPHLVVLSNSLQFDLPRAGKVIALSPWQAHQQWQQRREQLIAEGHEVLSYRGSIANAIRTLHHVGIRRICCEGGPWLYTQLSQADCIDKLYFSLAPVVCTPVQHPLFLGGDGHTQQQHMRLEAGRNTEDGLLFLRYSTKS
ncbi:dihydrofolate reductase family protein [Corynebacterium pseudopelargi]|uniref:5-amino-6-(5-phosphoribosylamino)uracil reductase n=1 Tax=Corynebacterium pseudopelargi TaxID=2080757 RepID=A0A3G6ITR3_9CORY|nr:dihydrofolate reductase family protein [Corynebacterium pseudopelargi]AZA09139.1 5-amino-6-(5-phosphoribosylamino)uracil reductase [Corynebacterium pseudopelargi]